jgi:heme iron utilization protein
MSQEPRSVLQTVDDTARALCARLVREARFAALATLEPVSGYPQATRVVLTIDERGDALLLLSQLSAHTQALMRDARCSLLCGEPGNGEPLTYPRITLIGVARPIARNSAEHETAKSLYLAAHPKAALYADFGDFGFWRVVFARANLNAGFGRAYELSKEDLETSLQQ